jgi:hypothetical protein
MICGAPTLTLKSMSAVFEVLDVPLSIAQADRDLLWSSRAAIAHRPSLIVSTVSSIRRRHDSFRQARLQSLAIYEPVGAAVWHAADHYTDLHVETNYTDDGRSSSGSNQVCHGVWNAIR